MPIDLGRRLIAAGVVPPEEVEAALFLSIVRGIPFARALVDRGALTERSLEEELERRGGLALRNIIGVPALMAQLPRAMCRRLCAIPTRLDPYTGTIDVAAADPIDQHIAAEFGFHLGAPIRIIRALMTAVEEAIRRVELGDAGPGDRPRRATPAFPHGAPSSTVPPPPIEEIPIPLVRRAAIALLDPSSEEPLPARLRGGGDVEPPPPHRPPRTLVSEPRVAAGESPGSRAESLVARPPILREPEELPVAISFPSEPPPARSSLVEEPAEVEEPADEVTKTMLMGQRRALLSASHGDGVHREGGAQALPGGSKPASRDAAVEKRAGESSPKGVRSEDTRGISTVSASGAAAGHPPASFGDDEHRPPPSTLRGEIGPDVTPGLTSGRTHPAVSFSEKVSPAGGRGFEFPTMVRGPEFFEAVEAALGPSQRDDARTVDPLRLPRPAPPIPLVEEASPEAAGIPGPPRFAARHVSPDSARRSEAASRPGRFGGAGLSDGPPPLPSGDPGVILRRLRKASARDEVVRLVMRGMRLIAHRIAVFVVKRDGFQGWACNAEFGDEAALRGLLVPHDQPSILATATAASIYLGPIPSTRPHAGLLEVMAHPSPDVAAIVVRAGSRPAMVLLADQLGDTMIGTRRMDELANAAGEALSKLLGARG